jgi:hypothetical protein
MRLVNIFLVINIAILAWSLNVLSKDSASKIGLDESIWQSMTFITLNDTIVFPADKNQELLNAFMIADSIADICADSSRFELIRTIGSRKLTHHYIFVSDCLKFDNITILDTINNKQVCIIRFDNYLNNLTIYKDMYYGK